MAQPQQKPEAALIERCKMLREKLWELQESSIKLEARAKSFK